MVRDMGLLAHAEWKLLDDQRCISLPMEAREPSYQIGDCSIRSGTASSKQSGKVAEFFLIHT